MMVQLLLAASAILSPVVAFTTPIPHASSVNRVTSRAAYYVAPKSTSFGFDVRRQFELKASEDDNEDTATAPRKRRTRKDGKSFSPPVAVTTTETEEAEEEDVPAPVAPVKPKENVVVMQVRDIRDVVSGAPEQPAIVDEKVKAEKVKLNDDDNEDELADDEEWEYYDVDDDGNEIITSDAQPMGGRGQDDSIEQLLADARSMRAASPSDGEEDSSMKDAVFNIISTIVTVDFFFVMALFVWFLSGIFCSYVLKDDAVQIAFNMNFQGVTQP